MLGGKEHLMNSKDKEPEKKPVADIVKEVVDMMNDPDNAPQSLVDWYNKPTRNNTVKWTGD